MATYPVIVRTGGHGSGTPIGTFTMLPAPDPSLRPSPYRDMLVGLPTFWRENPLRTQFLIDKDSQTFPNAWVRYDPNEDAAMAIVPAFVGFLPIASVGEDRITFQRPLTTQEKNLMAARRGFLVDDEIMTVFNWTVFGQQFADGDTSVLVTRAQFGTALASHAAGTLAKQSRNSLPNQVRPPLGTADGNTYLITWDVKYDSSYLGTDIRATAVGHKEFQLSAGKVSSPWLEVRTRVDGIDGIGKVTLDRSQQVGLIDGRYYADASATFEGLTFVDQIRPQTGRFLVRPNVWVRSWWFIDQRADDYDRCTLWMADETPAPPVLIFDSLHLNAREDAVKNRSVLAWWLEQNSSDDLYRGTNGTTGRRDLISWAKNVVALRGLTLTDVQPLLLTPGQMA